MSALKEDEIVDLEEYGRAGRPVPVDARRFRIRIDRVQYVVDVPEMTGRQILELAGKTPPEQCVRGALAQPQVDAGPAPGLHVFTRPL
jgi:hypothetical protein